MSTITKLELANEIVEKIGVNKREAKEIVDAFFTEISSALKEGTAVKLSGLGNFVVREKKKRPGLNPRTGEAVTIEARRVVVFHAGEKLRTLIAERSTLPSKAIPDKELA